MPRPRHVVPSVATCAYKANASTALYWACMAAFVVIGSEPWRAMARAQTGGYMPVSTDLLLQARPVEGLVILHSGYRNSPFVDADALVFMDASQTSTTADVLSVSVGLREPHGYGQMRLGRFMLSSGAIRPVQIDGVSTLARAPSGSTLEMFAGLPVVPSFGARPFDWLAGSRIAQQLDERVTWGVSYLQRRDAGMLASEELGSDLSMQPLAWLGIHAIGAWDLLTQSLAEARLSSFCSNDATQLELFASRRVAARLLPATSLFSVISDAPSSEAGANLNWRAFPRLDLGSTLALEGLDSAWGYRAAVRSTLRFSDTDRGSLTLEAMRHDLNDAGFSGAALRVDLPVTELLRPHASVELAAADHPHGRGALWPWARVGASYMFASDWLVAAALGFRATPQYRSDLSALVRIAYSGQVQP
jgi:hypothetical protein